MSNPIDAELADIYIPSDGNADVVCYKGTWFVKTDAGNMQTAREILKDKGGTLSK